MIPSDVASSLRQMLPDTQTADSAQARPVLPTQRVVDVLSNLVPGQRVLAEIQAVLPNGNYRAVVAQRDVTLSLPSTAKAGDSVELEVVDSDGKLTLAFIVNRGSGQAPPAGAPDSAATLLSTTGKLIGDLLNGLEGEGKRAPAAPLNGNQALVEAMPKKAADLAPVLKQALTQSGVFYEAHQARWVSGNFPTESLRQEPQSRFSPPPVPLPKYDFSSVEKFSGQSPQNISQAALGLAAVRSTPFSVVLPANEPAPGASPPAGQGLPTMNPPATPFANRGQFSGASYDQGQEARATAAQIPGQSQPPGTAPVQNQLPASVSASDIEASPPNPGASNLPSTASPGPDTPDASPILAPRDPQSVATPPPPPGVPAANTASTTGAQTSAPTTTPGDAPAGDSPEAMTQQSAIQTANPQRTGQAAEQTMATRPESSPAQPQTSSSPATATGTPFPRDLAPLVQQQLDGLATQNFAWQGQVWPGQQMWWEIAQNPEDNRAIQGDPEARWKTRLKLNLPSLGGIDVILNLRAGNDLGISATTNSAQSEALLRDSADQLRQQLEAAGMTLSQLSIRHGEITE